MTSSDIAAQLATSTSQVPENLTVRGSTFVRYGNHIVVGERRPLSPHADLNPANLVQEEADPTDA